MINTLAIASALDLAFRAIDLVKHAQTAMPDRPKNPDKGVEKNPVTQTQVAALEDFMQKALAKNESQLVEVSSKLWDVAGAISEQLASAQQEVVRASEETAAQQAALVDKVGVLQKELDSVRAVSTETRAYTAKLEQRLHLVGVVAVCAVVFAVWAAVK